jgi:hypothetical protein
MLVQTMLFFWTIQSSDGSTTGWQAVPGAITPDSRPTAAAFNTFVSLVTRGPATYVGGNLVDLAIRGTDSQVHWQRYNASTKTWNLVWTTPAGNMPTPSAPTVVRVGGEGSPESASLVIRGKDNKLFFNDVDFAASSNDTSSSSVISAAMSPKPLQSSSPISPH